MINKIVVVNHRGEYVELELKNPGSSGFFVRSISGLGPSDSNVNLTETLTSDGGIFNSVRQLPRYLIFNLGFYDDGSESVETIRQKLYRYFPKGRELTLIFYLDNRIAYTTGFVEKNEPNVFSKDSGSSISLVCPSAYFYSFLTDSIQFGGTDNYFEFPFENPSTTLSLIEMSQVNTTVEKSIYYTGDVETGVLVHMDFLGAVTDPAIHNITSGKSMIISSAKVTSITGENLKNGDTIDISTIKNNKYIYLTRNGVTYNILNALTSINDWFTIDTGDNLFNYTAVAGVANIQFKIEYRLVYEGI